MSKSPRRHGIGAALALVSVIVLSACSSPSEVAANAGSSSAASSGPTSDTAQQALKAAYDGQTGTPPSVATHPKAGVSVWVVSCGQQVPSCATPVAAAQEAAKAAGWTSSVCDGALNPGGWGDCVRQGVSSGADVILPVGIDCASIQQPFQEAKDAGVTVVGGGASDCDETGGQALWATERIQLQDTNAKGIWELSGKLAADWLIGKTDGKAQVLQTVFTDPLWGPWQAEGFKNEIATCSGCDIVATLELANNDFVSGSANQKFSTALLQAPKADSVFVAVGGWMVQGFGQAIQSSGRSDQLNVISGFGDASNMDLIRSGTGGQDAVLGYATPWGGWGSVDEAIRVLNGEQPVVEGDGMQVVDADHNLPKSGDYTGGVDYQAAYKKAWGVSS
jgi:ribose transport system substrate-binding protein